MPNNRQWATIFWATVLLVWLIVRKETRSSVGAVARAAISPKILIPLLVFIAWVAGLVYAAWLAGLWDEDRITDSVFWFVTAGLVLFARFERVSTEPRFVRRTTLAALEFSAFVEVLSEVFVLNLAAEFVLQPVLALFGGTSVVAAMKQEHHRVKKLVDALILLGSVSLLLYVVVSLVTNWGSLDKADLLQQLTLPVWLTVGTIPYVYVVGLLAAYELAFMRIDWKSDAPWWSRMKVKVAVVSSFRWRARELGQLTAGWQFKLAAATSLREARGVIGQFRRTQRQADEETKEREARLRRYSGSNQVDPDGRRLDRREFEESKKSCDG